MHRVNFHVHNMLENGQITEDTYKYLTTDIEQTQLFYALPKTHKGLDSPSGRPKLSGSGGPTEKISQFVDHFIKPLVPLTKSYIRDSTHMINILKDIRNLPSDTVLVLCALDASSPYANISHSEGIQASS